MRGKMTKETLEGYILKTKVNIFLYTIISLFFGYIYIFEGRNVGHVIVFVLCMGVGLFSIWSNNWMKKRLKKLEENE